MAGSNGFGALSVCRGPDRYRIDQRRDAAGLATGLVRDCDLHLQIRAEQLAPGAVELVGMETRLAHTEQRNLETVTCTTDNNSGERTASSRTLAKIASTSASNVRARASM